VLWMAFGSFDPKRAAWSSGRSGRGSSSTEEIRHGSATGASPRNGYGSGGKTSDEDASIALFECASCVCSRFVTGDMSSTTRRKWRYCTERVDDLSTVIPLTDIVVGCACGPPGILSFQARQGPQPEHGGNKLHISSGIRPTSSTGIIGMASLHYRLHRPIGIIFRLLLT
jgi:hypothetical protein